MFTFIIYRLYKIFWLNVLLKSNILMAMSFVWQENEISLYQQMISLSLYFMLKNITYMHRNIFIVIEDPLK